MNEVMRPYQIDWDDWIRSDNCFLSGRELEAIRYYQLYRTHRVFAEELHLSPSRISVIFEKAIKKLRYRVHAFRQWVADRVLEKAGLLPELTEKEKFLQAPLHEHKLSTKLYNNLALTGENLEEIIATGLDNIAEIKGIGKKSVKELIALFEKNNCFELING